MLDLILGLFFLVLCVRGWMRGFVKEAMDLAGVVLGVAVAFRLSGPAGSVVSGVVGSGPTVSRIVGGLILFLLVGGAAAILAHYLHHLVHRPGLALSNRLSGAGLAVVWGALLVTLALSVVSLFRLPPALGQRLDESTVATTLTDPQGLPHSVFEQVSGDRLLGVLLRLDDISDGALLVIDPEQRVEIPAATGDDLERDMAAAESLLRAINHDRDQHDLVAVHWSDALAAVAARHAHTLYEAGYLGHVDPAGSRVGARLEAAGLRAELAAENLALAPDPVEAHRGLLASPSHRSAILGDYTHVGIAAVDGPSGLLVVEVFSR